MVANGPGPSPRRRRTDNPVSAESIAQSNATLHVITRARQNRWMQGTAVTNGDVTNGDVTVQAEGNWSGNISPAAAASSRRASADQAASLSESNEARGLVDYESPQSTRPPTESRRSIKPKTSRQGLPSPALSDENNVNSPIIVSDDPATMANVTRPAGPRAASGQASPRPAATPRAQSATTIQVQNAQAEAQQLLQQYQPRSGARRQPSQTDAPSPLQRQYPPPATTLPSNAPKQVYQTAVGGGPQAHQRPPPPIQQTSPPPATRHLAHFYNPRNMHAMIDAQTRRLGSKFRNDNARLSLLRKAVTKGDYFYIVLSQLFCLRSTAPQSLPRSIKAIPPESWGQLEALLCENTTLLPQTVGWFSSFPYAITDVYSDPAFKIAYEAQASMISDFLTKLPQQWPRITWESMQREAPPLVQDMVEQMSLSSTVLQTTAFRAIATQFWVVTAQSRDVESGIDILVSLHQADQSLYFMSGRRMDAAQKRQAYSGFKEVFDEWKRYDTALRVRIALYAHQQLARQQLPFQLPAQALRAFGLPIVMPHQQQHQQQQQQQQQQQPLPPPQRAHQRQNSIPQSGRLTPDQQQQLLQQAHAAQQQAHALTQQQMWLNTAAAPGLGPLSAFQVFPTPALGPPRRPHALLPSREMCPRPQPTHPDSTRSALHQARARSPKLSAAKVHEAGVVPKLYRLVESCVLSPVRIRKDEPIRTVTFRLDANCKDFLPKVKDRFSATVTKDSHMYRLRCAVFNSTSGIGGFRTLSSWIEADNIWPETAHFHLNNTPLEPRRKLQHGRYLPIDLTHLVRPGDNELKIAVSRLSQDESAFDFAVAIEMIGVMTYQYIIDGLKVISAEDSLEAIKKSLSRGDASDDDDVMMVSSTMTIKLFDPISGSKIFDTPVRSERCLHRDPFDLETFLSICKRPSADIEAPTVVDTWRCPICRSDARPKTLVKDGFLVQVRAELAAKGLLDTTRAIVVNADGSWQRKEEERTGVRSASLEREERADSTAARVPRPRRSAPVVIELD